MIFTQYQVDAFTDKIFHRNPEAIIPLKEWPDEQLLQKIAMENNLIETAYFIKNENGYHIRWFTPEYEIDLCGHATLASAFIIKNYVEPGISEIVFSTQKAGVLKATANNGLFTLDFPSRIPQPCPIPELLLKSIGVTVAVEILRSRDYFVVLENEADVRNAMPDYTIMKELDTIGVIITAKGNDSDVVSRCFYPGAGIPEDPVTGSAHCNIVPYWANKLNKNKLFCRQISERGGDLWCELKGDRVLMSGNCVLFMQGSIEI
jgi:PhzF family phenazine biosynthesis protein